MRDLHKGIVVAGAATVLALAVGELVIRSAGLLPEVARLEADGYRLSDNPRLAYEPVPLLHGRNSLGFRDREHDRKKTPGVRRVLVLGDSIADGFGDIRREDAFPALLETLLTQSGRPTEVINLGVSGYNTLQEVELYKTLGARYDPDLVILAYCLNDRQFVTGELIALLEEAVRTGRSPGSRSRTLLGRSHLLGYARRVFARKRGDSAAEVGRIDLDSQFEPYRLLAADTVADSFAELAEASERNGHPVLVAIFPQFGDPREFLRVMDIQDYSYAGEHAFAEQLATRHGFQLLDLLEAFQRCDRAGRGAIARDSYHPTAWGHQCAATALAEYLGRNGDG